MSEVRQPRSIVTVNGGVMDFLSWEVNSNGYYQADTFSVRFVLHPYQAGWWSEQTDLDVRIYDGFPSDPSNYSISNLTLRILGRVDTIDLDVVHGVVNVTGRDFTSKLIDTKTTPPDPNKRASEVAAAYAAKYGLAFQGTKTTTKIGTYYNFDHVSMKVEKTPWDIICYLARQEQFICYVKGETLYFKPMITADKARVMVWDTSQTIPNGPAPELHFIRNLTLSRGIIVYVRSWNHKQPKGFTVSARAHCTKDPVTRKSQPLTGQEQVYSYTIPNLSRDAATKAAWGYLASISQHEVRFNADNMPGEPDLDPFQPVQWKYNGTWFAQTYYLDSVIRSFSFPGGYSMTLRGKNHSVETQVVL